MKDVVHKLKSGMPVNIDGNLSLRVMAKKDITSAVRESQARRHIVYAALRQGHYYPWDYQPLQLASEHDMRNHMDLNILEETKRSPRGE